MTSTAPTTDQYWSISLPIYIVGAPLLAIHSQAAGRYTNKPPPYSYFIRSREETILIGESLLLSELQELSDDLLELSD